MMVWPVLVKGYNAMRVVHVMTPKPISKRRKRRLRGKNKVN